MDKELIVIGGGLAGSEAAWQAAERGIKVKLYEMRPKLSTGAHVSEYLAELVCSNSLGSNLVDRASGLLKEEMRGMGSLLMRAAEKASVPAGAALAVDRDAFGGEVTGAIESHPNITLVREEMPRVPDTPTIVASGPLTSNSLSQSIATLSGEEHLYFWDAISPIVDVETVNFDIAYRASRYDKGEQAEGDYINCPFNEEEYDAFLNALTEAERIELKAFEKDIEQGVKAGMHHYFEGCLPIEIIASRGRKSLAYGPMRPVGLRDPRTGRWPYAVLQLRQDNLAGTLYNLVGFQTNLKFAEQRRVFRLIPGLENASFERYGQMHRNTFIFSPKLLDATMQFRTRSDLFFAGQITGVEGYAGNIATGLLAGVNAARHLSGQSLLEMPVDTMLGALSHYVSHADSADFQPMKANYGIIPALTDGKKRGKRDRAAAYSKRALLALEAYWQASGEKWVREPDAVA
jgi:methylenetetrahydrofolate--tRNA-(uracil-5-)-methyltransferase